MSIFCSRPLGVYSLSPLTKTNSVSMKSSGELCVDPSLGNPVPTLVDELPDTVYRYNVERYYVVYDLPDDATVRIWIIGKGPESQRRTI